MKWLILAGLCQYALSTEMSSIDMDLRVWGTETPQYGKITSQGCFKDEADMTLMADVEPISVSVGSCAQECSGDYTIMGVQGQRCWCGTHMPQADYKTADEDCDHPCPAYPMDACGGIGRNKAWNIFNLGIDLNPGVYGKGGDDSSEDKSDKTTNSDIISTTESATSTITSEDETVTVTTTSTPDGTSGGNPTQTDSESASQTSDAVSESETPDEPGMGSAVGTSMVSMAVIVGASGLWFLL